MQFIWFSIVLVCLYFGTMYGFYIWLQKQNPKKLPVLLSAGCGAFLLGSFMLGLVCSNLIFSSPTLVQYTWIVGTCFAVMYCAARFNRIKSKAIWVPLVCAAGVYVLHKAMPNTSFDLLQALILTLSWSIVMSLVMLFDRLPLLNFLTIATWTMAFTTMYVLSLFGSPQIAVLGLLLLTPLWGLLNILVHYGKGQFGPYVSALLGFVMGGMIAICLLSESYGSALTMLSYYLFECFFFVLAFIGLHPLNTTKGDFLLGSLLTNNRPAAIIRVVFYRLLILSLIAALMWQTNKMGILFVIILVVLVDTYNRFKASGAPAPTIKTMWKDTKVMIKQAWQQCHQLISQPQKEIQKKPVSSKKTSGKKPTRGKKKK